MILKLLYNKVKMELIELELQTKQCSKCKEIKSFNEFSWMSKQKNIRQTYCKTCKHLYYLDNQERIKNRTREWQLNNPERTSIRVMQWQQDNREKQKKTWNKWFNKPENREKMRINDNFKDKITRSGLREFLLNMQEKKCLYCNKIFNKNILQDSKSIDHFIPVSKGGLNEFNNIVLCCRSCNSKKKNKLPQDFLKDRYSEILSKKIVMNSLWSLI